MHERNLLVHRQGGLRGEKSNSRQMLLALKQLHALSFSFRLLWRELVAPLDGARVSTNGNSEARNNRHQTRDPATPLIINAVSLMSVERRLHCPLFSILGRLPCVHSSRAVKRAAQHVPSPTGTLGVVPIRKAVRVDGTLTRCPKPAPRPLNARLGPTRAGRCSQLLPFPFWLGLIASEAT